MRRILAALLVLGLAAPAWARSEKTLAYPRDQVWPAAVRFLVVNEHLKITEKDGDAGYALFELQDEGKTYRGSLEVISIVRDGRPQVRFVVTIEDRPSWLELAMLTRLERKLRVELGSPVPAPTKPAEPRPDGPGPGTPKPAPAKPDDGSPPISPTP